MLPQNQKIIDALNEQLTAATRLRDRKKMADLQEAIRSIEIWMENTAAKEPDVSKWGFTWERPIISTETPPPLA